MPIPGDDRPRSPASRARVSRTLAQTRGDPRTRRTQAAEIRSEVEKRVLSELAEDASTREIVATVNEIIAILREQDLTTEE